MGDEALEAPARLACCRSGFVEDATIGGLNLYSRRMKAFDEHAHAVGTILATHVALGIRATQDKERAEQLDQALQSNREITLASGVLMTRGKVTRKRISRSCGASHSISTANSPTSPHRSSTPDWSPNDPRHPRQSALCSMSPGRLNRESTPADPPTGGLRCRLSNRRCGR